MTPTEYRQAIKTLGWSQLEAGRRLGVSDNTAQRYASSSGPSGPAARLIRLLVQIHEDGSITAEDALKAISA